MQTSGKLLSKEVPGSSYQEIEIAANSELYDLEKKTTEALKTGKDFELIIYDVIPKILKAIERLVIQKADADFLPLMKMERSGNCTMGREALRETLEEYIERYRWEIFEVLLGVNNRVQDELKKYWEENINDLMKKKSLTFYHVCPQIYEEQILEYGIIHNYKPTLTISLAGALAKLLQYQHFERRPCSLLACPGLPMDKVFFRYIDNMGPSFLPKDTIEIANINSNMYPQNWKYDLKESIEEDVMRLGDKDENLKPGKAFHVQPNYLMKHPIYRTDNNVFDFKPALEYRKRIFELEI